MWQIRDCLTRILIQTLGNTQKNSYSIHAKVFRHKVVLRICLCLQDATICNDWIRSGSEEKSSATDQAKLFESGSATLILKINLPWLGMKLQEQQYFLELLNKWGRCNILSKVFSLTFCRWLKETVSRDFEWLQMI